MMSGFVLNGCEKGEQSPGLKEYIYSYTTYTGETSYHFTNLTPDEMAEEYEDRTFVRAYECKGSTCPDIAHGEVGSMFLFRDTCWFLYDAETGTETPVGLPEDSSRAKDYVLLGETEPAAVAVLDRESRLWGLFSIGADRMITDFEYYDVHLDRMQDGCIVVRTDVNEAFLLDPLTGELRGEADPALFEE